MSKKFGKFFMAATIGAIAGGAYYFLKKKDAEMDDAFDEDDDFDEFDEDLDGDDASGKIEADRKYVDLDLTKAADAAADKAGEKAEQFKEGLDAAKAEATDKIVGAINDTAKAVDGAAAKVEEFFDDDDNSLDAM
ncbi:MAG: hypothetical protein NC231_08695 [Bacillus sp. (in: Bacteria)]|nr:hypothetical protein [Bacillus sp. (in: firmicutes)]MCM1427223.1 hypothetical protein [Eubacterium sp.]